MRIFVASLVCLLLGWITGCGKGQNELVHFVDQIVPLQTYNETLARYLHRLETHPEDPGEAHQLSNVLQAYQKALSEIPPTRDILIKSLHGQYMQAIEKAQNRVKPPDDPMFVLEARRAVMGLRSDMEELYETLGLVLLRENLSERYTLEWPAAGE